ncbi:Protein CBG27147 [Caenorhabditis briggsae]|uniref:Protein CBG27147 n=1 Tax=Caenorhabditis briggsae TaxID=6238 RepID=B6IL57_CAEBR|nr:Protein CBG27147 [Caenorhabditis briggsae]CAS00610.1 Protein CBG27147 [Caenorhabditis briggsae]
MEPHSKMNSFLNWISVYTLFIFLVHTITTTVVFQHGSGRKRKMKTPANKRPWVVLCLDDRITVNTLNYPKGKLNVLCAFSVHLKFQENSKKFYVLEGTRVSENVGKSSAN